jgi:hypothetical protein
LKKRDASLDWFQVVAKQPIDAADSVMLVEAASVELWHGGPERTPVYPRIQVSLLVVSRKTNQIKLELDTYPLTAHSGRPTLDHPSAHAAYLHFYSDYGFYHAVSSTFTTSGARSRRLRSGMESWPSRL